MSSQQSILKFFKRTSAEVNVVAKRKKTDTGSSIDKCLGYASSVNVAPSTVFNHSAISRKLPDSVKILVHDMGPEWRTLLMNVIGSVSFTKLADFLGKERESCTIYPPQEEVFTWSRLTPPCNVRVVILGQDPYHGPKQAHGLAFSVKRPQPPPPSLANMYKEIASDPAFSVPKDWPPIHGDLTGWAKQGVLLLNAVLTVRASQPNSHKDKGWEMLTSSVINYINLHCSHVVFLLWGASARVQGTKIDLTKHLVLHAPHPSPLSANRGFFGCQHFSKANAYLKKHGLEPIDWTNI